MIQDIIELSRYYGSDSRYTIAGGGNSSWKEGDTMMVKASGFPMGSIDENGFVAMSIPKLKKLWDKPYPEERSAREAQFLADIGNARNEGETLRPSVETLLHQLFPYTYVMHTHPTLVNGLGCSVQGKELVQAIFGAKAYWVPSMDPGYYLAATLYKLLQQEQVIPQVLILQNHGLFVAANTKEEVYSLHTELMDELENFFGDRGAEAIAVSPVEGGAKLGKVAPVAVKLSGEIIDTYVADSARFNALTIPLTPDQIVYAGPELLWLHNWLELDAKIKAYQEKWGKSPQVLGVHNDAIYVVGESEKSVHTAVAITAEAIRTLSCTELAGGVKPLSPDEILFIHNWEAEHYRSKVHKTDASKT